LTIDKFSGDCDIELSTRRCVVTVAICQLTCTEIRKQKEIEFDILHADIESWEGEV